MVSVELLIINKLGLHARAAAKLAGLAKTFDSRIQIDKNGQRANAKSIMGLMMLAAGRGSRLCLLVEGADEEAAAASLQALVDQRFGEAE
ncbi:MAG: HPr family phosphocarrier protein [Gammaproteobacteria bacterium SHHR-1]|uniref:HPr family phosphocarrier protein n=1 Tax=Magnetovirga frankeli TaxID=947516 RepID=UPI001293C045|nr:HPr family phosphocarrier protein [gamma proteobacterium SS-5]